MTVSIKSAGGLINEPPKILDLKIEDNINFNVNFVNISYKVEDADLQIVRHYITITDVCENKEITKEVGYEQEGNVFHYKVEGLSTRNKTYTIQIHCFDGLDRSNSNAIQVTTPAVCLYGLSIDDSNTNPTTSIVYENDSINFTPATSTNDNGWNDRWPFNKIRIVGLKAGNVTKEIQKNNKQYYVDGTKVPDGVDVMVEFPKIYWKTESISWYKYKILISDTKIDDTYDCYAHKVNGKEKDHIYIGCFLSSGEYVSKSGVQGLGATYRDFFSHCAQIKNKKGEGYCNFYLFALTLIRILFLLKYKTKDSQSILGDGRTGRYNNLKIGASNTFELDHRSSDGNDPACFLGIEDIWGLERMCVAGIKTTGQSTYVDLAICEDNAFLHDANEWRKGVSTSWSADGYIQYSYQDADILFLAQDRSQKASTTTGYTDYSQYNSYDMVAYGGRQYPRDTYDPKSSGIFAMSSIDWGGAIRIAYVGV